MKDFARLFVIDNAGMYAGWSRCTKTSFVIAVKEDVLEVKKKSGRDMLFEEVLAAFTRFMEEYEANFGQKIKIFIRGQYYRFVRRTGTSGCVDYFIEIDKGDGFPERRHLLRVSCFDKTSGFKCAVMDFLDFLAARGEIGADNGFYIPYRLEQSALAEVEMKVVKPRLTAFESGWTAPWNMPVGIYPLRVCYEEPKVYDCETTQTA